MRHQPISRIPSVASFARDSSVGMEKLNVSLSSFRAGDGASREDMPDLIVVWRPPGLRQGGNYHCGAYQDRGQYAHVYSPWLDAASRQWQVGARINAEWMEVSREPASKGFTKKPNAPSFMALTEIRTSKTAVITMVGIEIFCSFIIINRSSPLIPGKFMSVTTQPQA